MAAHWNHRVVKKTLPDGTIEYSVREVFYNNDGSIYAYTEKPVDIVGDTIEELKEYVQWVMNCLDKEILVDGEVRFAEPIYNNDDAEIAREKDIEGDIDDLLSHS